MTSARIASGNCSRCQRHSRCPARSLSPSGAPRVPPPWHGHPPRGTAPSCSRRAPMPNLLDGPARPRVGRSRRLEEVHHVLGTRGRPQGEQLIVGVGERAPAADGDHARVAVFGEDHGGTCPFLHLPNEGVYATLRRTPLCLHRCLRLPPHMRDKRANEAPLTDEHQQHQTTAQTPPQRRPHLHRLTPRTCSYSSGHRSCLWRTAGRAWPSFDWAMPSRGRAGAARYCRTHLTSNCHAWLLVPGRALCAVADGLVRQTDNPRTEGL